MTPTQPPAGEAQLTELHLDERGLEFRMKHPIVPLMAEHLAEAFKDAGGVNYVAFDVNCEDIGPLVLTMQRRLGETPEMQVRRLRATLRQIRTICAETHIGQERAYTALSRIDQVARGGLGG